MGSCPMNGFLSYVWVLVLCLGSCLMFGFLSYVMGSCLIFLSMFSNQVVYVAQLLGPNALSPRPTVGRTHGRTDERAGGRAEILENDKIKKTRSEILCKKTCLTASHHFSKALREKNVACG